MATVQRAGEQYVEFDEYIDYQLDKARNGIKWTDILAAAAGVAALLIGYLVLFVIADHWLFEGGVPRVLRLTMLISVLLLAGGWLGWRVVLPYLRRVNDLYAARMLEEAEPDLRGSLFGLIDSRRSGRVPAEEVRRTLEKRAATTLSSLDVEATLDRRPLMRMSYILLGVVLVACAYTILSPKRVGPSLLRAVAPTASVGVATRTEILEVRPGDASVLAGTELDVSVMIRGEAPDRVTLFYSTADRRFADEPIEMRLEDETTREYKALIIGDAGRGLTQDLSYRIVANDDAAGPFAVTVEQPPAAVVESVALQFPAYTGLEPVARDTPSIEAVDGTNVTLAARANRPLKSAKLVFADDERFLARGEEVSLRIGGDGTELTASWKLAVRSDGSSPKFYRIECRDEAGKTNPAPVVYPIAIRADQPPEITLHDPKSDLERPANAVIPLLISARDPDFQLREVTLRLEKRGQELPERNVLWEGTQSDVVIRHDWDLAPLGLKAGDVLSFYVQARDNREPEPNRRNIPRLNITITEPVTPEQVEQQATEDRRRQDAEVERNSADAERAEQPPGDGSDTLEEGEPRESGDERREPGEKESTETGEATDRGEQRADSGDRQESTGDREDEPSVKNDGSQDDQVLRKLLERQQNADANQQPQPDEEQPENQPREESPQQENQPQHGAEQQGPRQQGKGQQGQSGKSQQDSGKGSQTGRTGDNNENGEGEGAGAGKQPGASSGDRSQQEPMGTGDTTGDPQSDNPSRRQGAGQGESRPTDDPTGGTPERERGEGGRESTASSESSPSKMTPDGTSDGNQPGSQEGAKPTGSQPEQTGERPSDGRAQDPSQTGTDGRRTGEQPRPAEGQPMTPAAADNERMESQPGRPNSQDGPPAATDREPGEGNPEQRTNSPDSGEGGTGQPNADGTPDGQTGPGDAGTRPGTQQTSDRPTGQPGDRPAEQGRPAEGQGSTASQQNDQPQNDQPQNGQPRPGMNGQPGNSASGGEQPQEGKGESSTGQQPDGENGSGVNKRDGSEGNQPGQEPSPQGTGQQSEPRGENGGSAEQQSDGSQQGKTGKPSGGGQQPEGGKNQEGTRGQQDNGPQSNGPQGEQNAAQGKQGGEQGGQQGQQGQPGQQGQSGQQQGNQPGESGGQAGEQGAQPQASGQAGRDPNRGGATGASSSGSSGGNQAEATGGPEAANPEFTKKATDLVLKSLEEDLRRGEVDPELLKELGWTKEDMQRFADRLKNNLAEPTADETPRERAQRQEFQHMLESLNAGQGPGARAARTDRVKNVQGIGTSNPAVPSEYRDAFEAFTRSVAGSRKATDGKQK